MFHVILCCMHSLPHVDVGCVFLWGDCLLTIFAEGFRSKVHDAREVVRLASVTIGTFIEIMFHPMSYVLKMNCHVRVAIGPACLIFDAQSMKRLVKCNPYKLTSLVKIQILCSRSNLSYVRITT